MDYSLVNELATKHGWNILPAKKGQKIPEISWKKYTNTKATDTQQKKWFNGMPKNIAIITGQISNLIVVDVDKDAGKEKLAEWLSQHDLDTFTVRTGSGGFHYYFEYDPEIKQTAGLFSKEDMQGGVDIRSDGGLVIGPYSTHQSGNVYEITNNVKVQKMPSWLKEEILKESTKHKTKKTTKTLNTTHGLVTDWVMETLTGHGIKEGNRNNSLAKLTGFFAGQTGLNKERTMAILSLWNKNLKQPLSYDEMDKTVESIYQSEYEKSFKQDVSNSSKDELYQMLTKIFGFQIEDVKLLEIGDNRTLEFKIEKSKIVIPEEKLTDFNFYQKRIAFETRKLINISKSRKGLSKNEQTQWEKTIEALLTVAQREIRELDETDFGEIKDNIVKYLLEYTNLELREKIQTEANKTEPFLQNGYVYFDISEFYEMMQVKRINIKKRSELIKDLRNTLGEKSKQKFNITTDDNKRTSIIRYGIPYEWLEG